MKKHPPRPPFLQDFCKNAQWRAKKLRERGSSTARPTEKGIGGLLIGSRPVDFGASIGSRPVDFGASIGSRPVDFGASRPVDFGASCRFRRVDLECCLCRDLVDSVESIWSAACVAIWRAGRFVSRRSQGANTKKSPIPQSWNRASAIARRRALLTFCKFLFQILVQAFESFYEVLRVDLAS